MTARPDGVAAAAATAVAIKATAATRSLQAMARGERRTCSEVIEPSERKKLRNRSGLLTMDRSRTSVNQLTIRAHPDGLVIRALPVLSPRAIVGKADHHGARAR